MKLPDAETEGGSKRNGVLSYAKEWHAVALGVASGVFAPFAATAAFAGVALGLTGVKTLNPKVGRQIKKEPWYALSGSLIGTGIDALFGLTGTVPDVLTGLL